MVELYDGGGGLPYLGSSTSYNAGDWENALRAYAKNGDPDSVYMNQIAQVDAVAERTIDASRARRSGEGQGRPQGRPRPPARPRSWQHGQSHKKLALVLDIDETSLSNYSAINADNFTFGTNSQAEATNEIGKAIPPTLKLFNDAKSRGVAVFFITGRGEASRAHTESNLTREGYSGWKQLYLKPAGSTATTVAYKTASRQDIEKPGLQDRRQHRRPVLRPRRRPCRQRVQARRTPSTSCRSRCPSGPPPRRPARARPAGARRPTATSRPRRRHPAGRRSRRPRSAGPGR